ncbi:hypothetical protein KY285_023446 [Solanum tuberosum]|nr:hypothetical protein KY289_023780 [Solanum tuberosum]KAH0675645.1 hypothetical protein KY285_023446 [Solanum tuberosum]
MVALLEVYKLAFQTQVVRWLMPHVGWWKCNTDGASRGNPGPSAAAFCISNSAGDLVGAKGVKIQDSTSIVAEAIVVREGLQYYWEHGLIQVLLESDSYALVKMLNGEWDVPWSVTLVVDFINRLRELMTVRVRHSLREGNTLADVFLLT